MTPRRALRFDLEWRTTALTLVLLPLLVGLGFWQLQRAGEKQALAAVFAERRAGPAAPLESLWRAPEDQLRYRPVTVRGRYDPERYLLLDNRIRDGRFGYEVVSLLRVDGGERAVLVNRGWVPGDPARRALPRVETPAGEVALAGSVYVPPGEPYLLGEQSLEGGWPLVLQALEMERLEQTLEQRLGLDLFPWSLRLAADDTTALAAGWETVNVSPAKHRAYAAQWFAMAGALLLVFLLRSSNLWQLLRSRDNPET